MPTWLHFGVNSPPRRLLLRCLQDALGRRSLVPKTAQEPPKKRARCAKNRPRAAPEASRNQPTGALEPKHATKQPQTPSRPRFWTILATIWKDFGIFLNGFFQINWIQTLETICWQCWGGCAPPLQSSCALYDVGRLGGLIMLI